MHFSIDGVGAVSTSNIKKIIKMFFKFVIKNRCKNPSLTLLSLSITPYAASHVVSACHGAICHVAARHDVARHVAARHGHVHSLSHDVGNISKPL